MYLSVTCNAKMWKQFETYLKSTAVLLCNILSLSLSLSNILFSLGQIISGVLSTKKSVN